MSTHSEQLDTNLAEVLGQIRGSLSPLRRATLEVLVISLVHARDIANSLVCTYLLNHFVVLNNDRRSARMLVMKWIMNGLQGYDFIGKMEPYVYD